MFDRRNMPIPSSTHPETSQVDIALCRATLYGALALGFRRPTGEVLARLISAEGSRTLEEAASILDAGGKPTLIPAIRRLVENRVASAGDLEECFYRLFGHTARGGTSPYETEYGTEALFQQPQEMGDLMGFYRAFGLTLNPAEHERADHISCECEFLSFLALKEAYALEHEESAMLEETRKANRLFLQDHLGRFVPAFTKKLAREDRDSFYGALADLCYCVVTQDCARLGVPVGSQNLSLRPANDDRVPMACGSGAECMAMPGTGGAEGGEEK